jgi:trans-aconitate 2-methyltransferase
MTTGEGKEWNAEVYHRISRPQQTWGAQVLERLPLRGDETVLDAGCGSGILTGELLERLPNGRVIALDRSENMLAQAREHLEPRFPGQVTYIAADLGRLDEAEIPEPVDAIFSTETFHWVHDHDRLFRGLSALLKPGGRLIAQCGGGPNIGRILDRAKALMRQEPFAPHFATYVIPMHFAGPETTAERLSRAGFTNIRTWLTEAPTVLDDESTYREFLTNVIFHHFLEQLPDVALRREFIERLVVAARSDDPPYSLDYWRLNIKAQKTGGF